MSDERRGKSRRHGGQPYGRGGSGVRPSPQSPDPKVTAQQPTPSDDQPPAPRRRGFLGFGRGRPAPVEPPANLAAARRQVADLQRRHDRLEAALVAIRRDLAAAAAERDGLRQRAGEVEAELGSERVGHAMAQLQLRESREKGAEAQRQGVELHQALTAEQSARQQWEATATDLRARLAALEAEHEQLRQDHGAVEIAHHAERQAHERFESLAAERGSQLEALRGEHAALSAAQQQLSAAHAVERRVRADAEALAAEKSAALEALTTEHASLTAAHQGLTGAHAEEQRQRELAEITAAAHATRIDNLTAELATVRADLAATQESLAAEQAARATADAHGADLQGQLDSLRADHVALTEQHQSLQADHVQLGEAHQAEQAARTQWEAHAKELSDTLAAERELYQRTLEDERRTAEAARAEQAFQHREQVERLTAEHTAALTAVQQQLAQTTATLETTTAELGASRADVVRLTEDLQASRGEAEAAATRAHEEIELRTVAERRREEVEEELAFMRTEVMGGVGGGQRKRGLLRRGGKPVARPASELPSHALSPPVAADAPPAPPDEEVEEILERRLFGDG